MSLTTEPPVPLPEETPEPPPEPALSDESLAAILAAHAEWVRSFGKAGERADLTGADLSGRDLHDADLRGAALAEANLQDADLSEANLRAADLRGANLQGASLRDTILRDAHLQDANLAGVTGLLAGQLAGTNVCGAKLPDAIAKFDVLSQVADTSKTASAVFVSMLVGCGYTWLTIASTHDMGLITDSATSNLPVINTAIPIVGFYFVAPLLLLGLYLYFHLTIQRLWEQTAELPAIFPDGRSLDRRLPSWLINGLIHPQFHHLKETRPALSWLQEQFAVVIGWWLVPITVFLIWGRYLRKHDHLGTACHVALVVVACSAAWLLYRLGVSTLRADPRELAVWRHPWRHRRTHFRFAGCLLMAAFLATVSYGAIEGVPVDRYGYLPEPVSPWNVRHVVPLALESLGYNPFADLEGTDLSTRPPNWDESRKNALAQVKGARLRGAHLRRARMHGAFLVNADLRDTGLWGARLPDADLRRARAAGANFSLANLQDARIEDADLRGARFDGANLAGAQLAGAHLEGVDLSRANGLTRAQVETAQMDGTTKLPEGLK